MLRKLPSSQKKSIQLSAINFPIVKAKYAFKTHRSSQKNHISQSSQEGKDQKNIKDRFMLFPERHTDFMQSRFRKKDNCVQMNISCNGVFMGKRSKDEILEELDSLKQSKIDKDMKKISHEFTINNKENWNKNKENIHKSSPINEFLSNDYFKAKKNSQFSKKFNQLEQKYNNANDMKIFMDQVLDATIFHRFKADKRSRYDLHYLYSMHKTIFAFSKGDSRKIKKSFLIVLNLSGILVDEEKLDQINFVPHSIQTFEGFMKKFKDIETYYFQQSIQDYLYVIFSSQEEKTPVYLLNIQESLSKRMAVEEAAILTHQIVEKIQDRCGSNVKEISLQILYDVCINDQALCQKIHEKYKNELQKGKFNK